MSESMKLKDVVTIARSLKSRAGNFERFAKGQVRVTNQGFSLRFQDMPNVLRQKMQRMAQEQSELSDRLMDSVVVIDI